MHRKRYGKMGLIEWMAEERSKGIIRRKPFKVGMGTTERITVIMSFTLSSVEKSA